MNEKLIWGVIGGSMMGASLGVAVTLGVLKKKMMEQSDLSEMAEEMRKVIEGLKKNRIRGSKDSLIFFRGGGFER